MTVEDLVTNWEHRLFPGGDSRLHFGKLVILAKEAFAEGLRQGLDDASGILCDETLESLESNPLAGTYFRRAEKLIRARIEEIEP